MTFILTIHERSDTYPAEPLTLTLALNLTMTAVPNRYWPQVVIGPKYKYFTGLLVRETPMNSSNSYDYKFKTTWNFNHYISIIYNTQMK